MPATIQAPRINLASKKLYPFIRKLNSVPPVLCDFLKCIARHLLIQINIRAVVLQVTDGFSFGIDNGSFRRQTADVIAVIIPKPSLDL